MRYYDLPDPSYIPRDSMPFFGADPSWTPEKERQAVESCDRCGGRMVSEHGDGDPLRRLTTVVMVCAGCSRSPYDGTAAIKQAVKRDNGVEREGWDETSVWTEVPARPPMPKKRGR